VDPILAGDPASRDPRETDLLEAVRCAIDARLAELRPLRAEYERLLEASAALGVDAEGSGATAAPSQAARPPRRRAPPGAAREAILAALAHGSHSIRELQIVTALDASLLRYNVARLLHSGRVTELQRAGVRAFALAHAPPDGAGADPVGEPGSDVPAREAE
jgi:hypothetical protein